MKALSWLQARSRTEATLTSKEPRDAGVTEVQPRANVLVSLGRGYMWQASELAVGGAPGCAIRAETGFAIGGACDDAVAG